MKLPMKLPIAVVAALLAASLLGTVLAFAPPEATDLPEGSGGLEATVEDLAWLAGSWRGDMSGSEAQEVWSKPAQGALMGMFRLLGKERTSVFEFLLIEQEEDGLQLRFQHFGPGYRVWEKDGPLEFRLSSTDGRLFTFESPDPTQAPSRITYSRPSEGKLIVTVETLREGAVKDSFDVVYERVE